jgi:hypothetical protein
MKTLLLNPPKHLRGIYVCREENGIGEVDRDFLPSSIYLAAAYLRETGKDADALDAETPVVSFDGYDAVVVWVCILHSFYEDVQLLKRAKEEGRRTVMILNDAHEGLEMEAMQRFDFIDASIRLWEREIILGKLLASWEEGVYPDFPGVIYRKDGVLVDTGRMPYLPNLEHVPSCSGILGEVPLKRYSAAAITTGRGCPMPHTFCMYSRTDMRRRKVEDVVAEIEAVSSMGRLLIMDPSMPTTDQWRDAFCDRLIARKIRVAWRTDAKLQQCNAGILKKLKAAGCDSVMLAIETLDADVKAKVKGGTSHQRLKTGIENIKRAGMVPIPVFFIGFPWDSSESLAKIDAFLKEVAVPSFILKQVRPWRWTALYQDCRELGLLERDLGIDDYVHSDNPLVDTLYLSRDEIVEWKYRIRRDAILNWRYICSFLLERGRVTRRQAGLFLRLAAGCKGGWDRN